MNFAKLYYNIWNMKLEPNAFRTYLAILKYKNHSTDYANVSMKKLAKIAGISRRCLIDKIAILENRGLISVVKKYFQGHRIANGYKVAAQYGKFTMIPCEALTLPLTAFGFKVYTYLIKCADKRKAAFPSLSGLSKAVGATIKTIITQIAKLVKLGLITKANYIKRDSSFGHNQYCVLEDIEKRVEKKAHLQNAPFQDFAFNNIHLTNRLSYRKRFVKMFVYIFTCILSFFKRGYCNFCTTSKRTISYYKLEKRIKLYCNHISKLVRRAPRE